MKSNVQLYVGLPDAATIAATFIAELVRQGVVFEARHDGNYIFVTFSGGF